MTIDERAAHGFAKVLAAAEREGTAAPLASSEFADLDWEGVRRIALARDGLRCAEGDVCIGYKLGWTSAAMREALGIDRPNWGTLWESQQISNRLELTGLRHAKVEPELVYIAGRALAGERVNAAQVLEAAGGWALGIEVVSPRWPSFDFTWLDNTADNSSAAAVAIGPIRDIQIDPSGVDVTFSNGTEKRKGSGAQAMGSPAEAVAWLARELAQEGRSVATGQVIFTGGLTAPFDVVDGTRYTADSTHLDPVQLVASATRGL